MLSRQSTAMQLRLLCCLLGGSIVLQAASISIFGQDVWDPRGIRVFPTHKKMVGSSSRLGSVIADGRDLFVTRFNQLDGAGRPTATGNGRPSVRRKQNDLGFTRIAGPDANSCAGCHNQPMIGGSGDFASNVFVGANVTDPASISLDAKTTSERNTIGVAGSYAIELLAREITQDLHRQRDEGLQTARKTGAGVKVRLSSKGIAFGMIKVFPNGNINTDGLLGIDPDLVIKPFGSKGVVVSLREFTVTALNQHHGIQAVERFGRAQTVLARL